MLCCIAVGAAVAAASGIAVKAKRPRLPDADEQEKDGARESAGAEERRIPDPPLDDR